MNYIIWIAIGIVIISMAIVGYFADKNNQKNKKTSKISEANNGEKEATEGAATWAKNAKPKDERHETEHKVPSVDDWSKIPEVKDKIKEETPKVEKEEEPLFDDLHKNESEIKEVSTKTVGTPSPMPTDNKPVPPIQMPAEPENKTPSPMTAEPAANSVSQTEQPKEQTTEQASDENIWN